MCPAILILGPPVRQVAVIEYISYLLATQNPALNSVQNSKLLGIFAIYCENRKAGCGLAEEIYNNSN
jgi:hypothetical protein